MRQVVQGDAWALSRLIHAVGLDDNPDPERIARVILNTTRVTLVEPNVDGGLIGFADAFMTISADGLPRWEIDLLGVHPDYRGRGIAQTLVRASVAAGRQAGAALMRTLVKIDNAPSLHAFERCGFVPDAAIRALYVSDSPAVSVSLPTGAHLVPVCTLTYSGIWVEGESSAQAFRCAQAARVRYGWDIAGALVPVGAPAPEDFAYVGDYRWLVLEGW